ncbi:hypothetical protein [Myroides odoratus]|uniref:Uncharacterized protein n=1 Tax=Myroides odoratus TaxID=256 RepID=A0A378U2W1_MYROD|nr:hypothetical protein [Myroides odoratus]STZ69004.1 Uncharacterised protein [Myroides odoratus]
MTQIQTLLRKKREVRMALKKQKFYSDNVILVFYMKKCWIVLVLCVLFVFSGCKSDDDLSKDSKELRTLLNHEWEATEIINHYIIGNRLKYPFTTEKMEELFNTETYSIENYIHKFKMGMNKKGGFYYVEEIKNVNTNLYDKINVMYMCTTQEEDRIFGKLNYIPNNGQPISYEADLYVRKIDENTIKLLMINHGEDPANKDMTFALFVLNKKGAWNENTAVQSILESFGIDRQYIEFIGGEHFERDVAQGRCK